MNLHLRILIVDDDRRMTRTLADIFSLSGYEAIEAWSGIEALEKARATNFDCVLTDVRMPDMDGVELHRHLRATLPGLPVLLMTAYASDRLIGQGLDEGVVGIFDKPLNINQLLNFFASLASKRVVVIVNDDPVFCRTLEDILRVHGFMVTQTADPRTDLEQLLSKAQVVMLDLKLNGFSGMEVLKKIRKGHPTLPVILITGYREEMAALQSRLDIDDAFTCLYKPLEIPQLLEILAKLQVNRLREAFKLN